MTIEAEKSRTEAGAVPTIEMHASLAVIMKRNRFIGTLRETREFYQKKRLLPALLLRAVTKVVIAKTKLAGHQYLDLFRENIGGQQLTIAANHTSDADHPSLALALTEPEGLLCAA